MCCARDKHRVNRDNTHLQNRCKQIPKKTSRPVRSRSQLLHTTRHRLPKITRRVNEPSSLPPATAWIHTLQTICFSSSYKKNPLKQFGKDAQLRPRRSEEQCTVPHPPVLFLCHLPAKQLDTDVNREQSETQSTCLQRTEIEADAGKVNNLLGHGCSSHCTRRQPPPPRPPATPPKQAA